MKFSLKAAKETALLHRIAGLTLLLLVFVFLDPLQSHWLHRLLLPIAAISATALILRNLFAITLTCLLISTAAMDMAGDVYQSLIYPGIALVSLCLLVGLWIKRVRQLINSTHKDRWQNR